MEIGKTYRLNDHGSISSRFHGNTILVTRIEERGVGNRVWFTFPENPMVPQKCFRVERWNDYVIGAVSPTKWAGNILKFKFV